jgi:3-hydroxyacyl-[acyl-carrier-protein] dehydratase
MPPPPLYDLSKVDLNKPLYDLQEIRRVNPQRHEMEQLTAVLLIDKAAACIVGYKDVTEHEFWVQGHMPSFPLMPGVVMCECAAQLAGYYARKHDLLGGDYLGFGGMDNVRFRSPIYPGCRLVIIAHVTEIRKHRRGEAAAWTRPRWGCGSTFLGWPGLDGAQRRKPRTNREFAGSCKQTRFAKRRGFPSVQPRPPHLQRLTDN